MPEQRADQRQARAAGDQLARIAVAEIVQPQALDARRLDDPSPTPLEVDEMTAGPEARKHKLRARALTFADVCEECLRRRGEGNLVVLALLGRAWRLRPDAILDVRPAHAEHFAAPGPGQQQQPDGVGGLALRMPGQRPSETDKLVAAEIAATVIFDVALDAPTRIRLAHMPAHGERKHLAENRHSAVRAVGTTGLGDLAMQRVDVLEADIRDLGVLAEMRLDVQPQQTLVIARSARTLAWEMLGPEAFDQVRDRGCRAFLLDRAERIAAVLDLAA